MKPLFLLVNMTCLVLVACSTNLNPPFEVIRDCRTSQDTVKKCVLRYSTTHDGPSHYRYFIRVKAVEGTVFQYLQNSKKNAEDEEE